MYCLHKYNSGFYSMLSYHSKTEAIQKAQEWCLMGGERSAEIEDENHQTIIKYWNDERRGLQGEEYA